MNSSDLAKNGGFVIQSLRALQGNRPGVVAALFTMLLLIAGCGGSTNATTPTSTFTPAAGSYSATQNVTVADTNQNAVLYCTNDGSAPTASSPQCANPIKVSQSQTIKAIAISPGMANSAVATAQYTISATAAVPTVTGIGPATGSSSGGISVTIVGTNFTGVTAVKFGTTPATSFTVNSATNITAVSPSGTGSVHVTVVAAGGASATTSADLFSYGTVPVITSLNPASAAVGSAAITLAVSGGNFTSDALVEWNGSSLATSFVSSTQLTATVPASLLANAGTATVTITESGGASTGVAFAISAAAPSIAGISPAQGQSAGGTAVNITGANFTGVSAVKFGGATAANFTVNSATSITAVSPASSAGAVDIQIVTLSGATTTGISDQFTYLAPPAVTAISPLSGSSAGGTEVTISGLNLTGATSVSFGTTAAAGFTVNSATSITAISPAGSAGTVDIRVVTPGGTSTAIGADQFLYIVPVPTVTGLSVTAGKVAGGSTVNITGTNFTGATAVNFGGTPATFTVNSATSITAVTPAESAGTVDVTVVTKFGTSATGPADQFSFSSKPVVTSVTPSAGILAGGTAVTIHGANFSGATAVNFGSTSAANFSVSADGSSISAASPAESNGPVDITVVTPGGTSATGPADQFTFLPQAEKPVISVPAGAVKIGAQVTILESSSGATVYYTLDGSQPSATNGTPYSGPIAVNEAETINAIAVGSNYLSSEVTTAAYTVMPRAATPVISQASGAVPSGQSVTITEATSGATVRYTLDGSTPSATNGATYTTALTVTSAETLKAVAVASGYSDSYVRTAVYTLQTQAAMPVISLPSGTIHSYQNVYLSDATPGATIYYTTDNTPPSATNGTVYGFSSLRIGSAQTLQAIAIAPGHTPSAIATATYTTSATAGYAPTISPAGGVYTSAQTVTINTSGAGAHGAPAVYYTLDGSTPTTSSTLYSSATRITVSTSETVQAIEADSGVPSYPVAVAGFTLNTAAPAITPNGGSSTGAQTVTLTDTTSGAAIYYTLDGSTPTISSPRYTAPISLSNTTSAYTTVTVQALAVASGFNPSTGSSAAFNVFPAATGSTISGTVASGVSPAQGSTIALYAAGTTGYGSAPTPIPTDPATVVSDQNGAFTLSYTCPGAPGDQLYLVASEGDAGQGPNSNMVMIAALGSCNSSTFPTVVTVNEVTTIASAFSLAQFATIDSSGGIDIGAPTSGSSCNATAGWKSTGASTCNYIGLKNAFATVANLVDLPSGQALAVTPAYCASGPCLTAANTTPLYATSIVPQGRINAMANALAACVNPPSGNSTNCGTLFTATEIQTSTYLDGNGASTTCAAANLNTPKDTLQAALNIAHFPSDRAQAACGVDVASGAGIYSLVPATNPPYTPTLTASTSSNPKSDLSLALIFQGGGLGGPGNGQSSGVKGPPTATGLAIDAGGNIWVPTTSKNGGSVVVLNNQGASISAAGNSSNNFGGYTAGVYNPLSIAIDQNGNAWIGNSPSDGGSGQKDNGSLSEIQLNTSTSTPTLSTLLDGPAATAVPALLTPSQYGLAIDASNNVWLSSNPGVRDIDGGSQYACQNGTFGGSILEFNSAGSPQNGSGYLSYSDSSSCPATIAFDESGLLWAWDAGTSGKDPNAYSVVQIVPSSGSVAGGIYSSSPALVNPSYNGNNPCANSTAAATANMVIDALGDSWFTDTGYAACMFVIPNMTDQGASAAINQGTLGWTLAPASWSTNVGGATVIDGGDNAWSIANSSSGGGYLIGYSSENASSTYEANATDTALLTPQPGFNATDPSANASGRSGGFGPLFGGGTGLGVDGSGNLWVSGVANGIQYGSRLTEFIGIAVPAQTPLATALKNNELGQKP